jgi:hypothetical protein
MARATGIELCPDSCLLAGIRPLRGGDAEVFALRRLEGLSAPTQDQLIVQSLQTIRQTDRLPPRAFVVAWKFDRSSADQSDSPRVLTSVQASGFQVASVLAPSEALLRLAIARQRTSPTIAVAWLALNQCGAAIAIVRGTDLLFERTIRWIYKPDLKTGKAQALQRYLLVAHLATELGHGIDVVRAEHGLPVDLAVACGDLPELRSLTMPLIEELDIEVETLDSMDGLRLARGATVDEFAESSPALRLAIAATLRSVEESRRDSIVPALLRAAAVITLVAIAWVGYSYWHRSRSSEGSQIAAQESAPLPIATQGRREPNRAITAEPSASNERREKSQPASTDRRTVAAPPAPQQPPTAPLLREPLPRIDTVLIDQDRRLALVDGGVIAVGDAIGSRVVVGIERESVLLREPSGRTVRVRVRSGAKS